MKNASMIFVVAGCLLLLAGIVSKLIPCANPAMIIGGQVKPISIIILANTSFLLAILLKK